MFGSLRVKLAVGTLVLLVAGALGAIWYIHDRLSRPYEQTVQAELQSIGRTLAVDLNRDELTRPAQLRERLVDLRPANPDLLAVASASWRG